MRIERRYRGLPVDGAQLEVIPGGGAAGLHRAVHLAPQVRFPAGIQVDDIGIARLAAVAVGPGPVRAARQTGLRPERRTRGLILGARR